MYKDYTYTSLVRARGLLPWSQVLGNDCHLDISLVNGSDSDYFPVLYDSAGA